MRPSAGTDGKGGGDWLRRQEALVETTPGDGMGEEEVEVNVVVGSAAEATLQA